MTPLLSALRRVLPFLFAACLLAPLSAAQTGRDSEFMKEFRNAMAIHDRALMSKLLKQNEHDAVRAIIETCEMISEGSNDTLEDEIDALGKAWRSAFDTSFVVNQYEYFSLLSGEFKRHRAKVIQRYWVLYAEFAKARDEENIGRLTQCGLDFEGMSYEFEEVGDLYLAALTAWHYAECFDRTLNKKTPDLRKACSGYGRALELRDKIGLLDSAYKSLKVAFDTLEFEGYGDPNKGPDARAAERAAGDSTFAPRALEATFEIVPEIDDFVRPNYFADSLYQVWPEVQLLGKDSSGAFPALEHSPKVIRTASAKAMVDIDGDGEGDVSVPVTGKTTPVKITLGQGDEAREWAFLATVGTERDTYQGIQPFNLAPDDNRMPIYIAPAASIVGMIGEIPVRILDDNMDGRYGSEPKTWAHLGVRKDDSQSDIDSILIGDAKRALPWSEYVKVGEDWYKFESNDNGSDITVTKSEIETGTLKLDLKGVNADYVILRGTGNRSGIFVDVAADKKGVEVPAGAYELFSGRVSKGSRSQAMKAMIVPAQNTRTWRAAPGETSKVELGAPFKFDFKTEQSDEVVTVKGTSIVVVGRGEETYQRLWNCVPRPEASERASGSKKGSKGKKMAPIENQNDMGNSWDTVWFPLDAALEKKKEGEPSEVQLIEKKNKLFGKIESDWKG